jgi:REP element-mobilizing transposase RayT
VYNRANENLQLFYDDDDYKKFLISFNKFLTEYIEFYAFCLIPNHFHFLVKTKQEEKNYSKPFSDFFNSYSRYLQVKYNLKGNIFNRPFKRLPITDNNYFIQAVYYIHSNPVHHKLTDNFKEYKWSSYKKISDSKESDLNKKELLEIFGGKENFIKIHNELFQVQQDRVAIEL